MKATLITPGRFDFPGRALARRLLTPTGCLAMLALLSLSSCTYLVDPETQEIRCQTTEAVPNPCAAPLVCIEGVCVESPACDDLRRPCPTGLLCQAGECVDPVQCEPALGFCNDKKDNDCNGVTDEPNELNVMLEPETCGDGEDNDCDGMMDEGHDADGDKFPWCGDTTDPNGNANADCNNEDNTIFPGAPELCDGKDNDCDGVADEADDGKSLCSAGEECIGRCVKPSCAVQGSIVCRADQMCDNATGQCVPRGCDPTKCAPNEFCDTTTNVCTASKKPNGTECGDHLECASGSCIESVALELGLSAPRVCGQSCCSDGDCKADERCYSPGNGARSCLPVALATRGANTGRLCTNEAQCLEGETCGASHRLTATGSVETQSVPCNAARECDDEELECVSGRCLDLLSGTACVDAPTDELAVGAVCSSTAVQRCGAKVCIANSFSGGATYFCTNSCSSSADCATLAGSVSSTQRTYCQVVPAPEGYLPICVIDRSRTETGTGADGTACDSPGDCLDGGCVRTSSGSVCASTCCNDNTCPPIGGQATHCRPIAIGSHFEPRCVL